jgi:hypothetical protein
VVHCGNADCSAGNLIGFPEFSSSVLGWYLSLAIGSDGLPVISYYDERAGGTLRVAHCDTLACNGLNTATTVDDPTNRVGAHTAIAIGTDGLPVISYQDQTAAALKVAHCGNPACTSGNTVTTLDDPANAVGQETAIAIGADGLPVISYVDYSAYALKVAHCGNPECSSGNTATTIVDPDATVLGNTSIAVGADGLPVISYYDAGARSLKVLHCGNLDCTAGNLISTLDPPPFVGEHSSIAAPADGPVISYFDNSAGRLKLVKCGTVTCR